jgi:hypothetical protein
MNKKSLVNESREYDTCAAVKKFIEDITDNETKPGKHMDKEVKRYAYVIASSIINLIKYGGASEVEEALKYGMIKTGLKIDVISDWQCHAQENILKTLEEYNGGSKAILNKKEKYVIFAEDELLELREKKEGLTFAKADFTFDLRKSMGAYPHVSLIEGDTAIRTYKKNIGEERSIRYEVLNELSCVLTKPENITYLAMDAQDSYVYHQDSGHGWIEVPIKEIKAMGLEERITPYSYLFRDKAYLEEDDDASAFLDMRKLLPKPFVLQSNYKDGSCFIRNYPHYRPENIMPENSKSARKNSRKKDVGWER